MTESLLNNEKCFLAQPAWQAVFHSLIVPGPDHEISDRSEAVVSLLILKSRVSALFADVTASICRTPAQLRARDAPRLDLLRRQASALRGDLVAWRASCDRLLACSPVPCAVASVEHHRRCEIVSTCLSCGMIANRLLTAVSFGAAGSARLEEETQRLARQVLQLEALVEDVCPRAKLFLAHTVLVAKATIATAGDWAGGDGAGGGGGGEGTVIEKWRFERWCGLFGRKVS